MKRKKAKAAMSAGEFQEIRTALGLSQYGLSERTGIHRVTIAKFETGDYPILKPIAELMRCLHKAERTSRAHAR